MRVEKDVKVGDKLRDNDPRMGHRVLVVIAIHPNGVTALDSKGRAFTYIMRRIHTDSRIRKTGLSVVRPAKGGA